MLFFGSFHDAAQLQHVAYGIVLAALEIAVVFIEYRYYVRKYTDVRCAKLLLFSIAANVLSLAIGGLVQYFFL